MRTPGIDRDRLVALFAAGCLLFSYPLLSLVNLPATVLGVPVLYLYIFLVWAVLIGVLAWILERRP